MIIENKKGDSITLTETIDGLTSLTGYSAKMYIYTIAGVEVDVITGSIDGLGITYNILNDTAKEYPVGSHRFETKLFDASDHVYTPSDGGFTVLKSVNSDPS